MTELLNLDVFFLCDPFFGGCHGCGALSTQKLDMDCPKCGRLSPPLCAKKDCYDAIMAGRSQDKLTGMDRMFSKTYQKTHPDLVVPGYEREKS